MCRLMRIGRKTDRVTGRRADLISQQNLSFLTVVDSGHQGEHSE